MHSINRDEAGIEFGSLGGWCVFAPKRAGCVLVLGGGRELRPTDRGCILLHCVCIACCFFFRGCTGLRACCPEHVRTLERRSGVRFWWMCIDRARPVPVIADAARAFSPILESVQLCVCVQFVHV